jgi:hypothetical protein
MGQAAGQVRFFLRAGGARRGFLAAAFTALSLLLLTPVCDALAAHAQAASWVAHDAGATPPSGGDGSHDSSACCVTIEGNALVKPASVVAGGGTGDAWRVAAIPFARVSASAPRLRPDSTPGALPHPTSFYARSARIRR